MESQLAPFLVVKDKGQGTRDNEQGPRDKGQGTQFAPYKESNKNLWLLE